MRESTRTILRGTASAFFVVGGVALVTVVAVRGYFAYATGDPSLVGVVDLGGLVVSAGLFVAAWRLSPDAPAWRRFRRSAPVEFSEPDPSPLEELGYRVPTEVDPESRRRTTYEDGTVYRRCEECGAKNEVDYAYCGECSAELKG
jgi:hypothetical protein